MHWKDSLMYRVKWKPQSHEPGTYENGRWFGTKDGGITWVALAADNILDATEAIEEAARRTGVSPQMFTILS